MAEQPNTEQPNIVLYWWDNFGWGELGCYGAVFCAAPKPPGGDAMHPWSEPEAG